MGQLASTSAATEVLAGLVERVTFHNEENGFCVLRVKARGQRDLITVLGHAAMISAGEFIQASGAWQTTAHTVSNSGRQGQRARNVFSSGRFLRAGGRSP
jgi:hypothetical protein